MKNFSPKNKIYLASAIAIVATIVFTMGFLSLKASACTGSCQPELCQAGETLTEFNYNSKPQSVFIDENTQNLADQLCQESYISVDTSDGNPHYIYLSWDNLGDLSGYENILKFNLLLNHKESSTTIKVELKNELDNWIEVCDPAERSSFIEDTCNLSPYFDTLKQVSPIELRVVVEKTGACHEYLKCAKLDVKLYHCEPPAPFCGDGIKNGQEECDGQDGVSEHYVCTDQCTLEYVPYCGDQICDKNETCETCSQDCGECPATNYCAMYFNHVPDGVEFEGPITGLIPGDNPFNHPNWWDIAKLAFEQNDSSLTFGDNFLPVDEGKDGDPFHFSAHWRALLNVSADGSYGYTLGSDDDAWLYIDGNMVEDLGGVHAPVTRNNSIFLTQGQHVFNLYFAERHTVQSYLYFEWTTPGIEVIAECEPYCGDETCNGQETCETCESDCGPCPECQTDEDCDDQSACTTDTCANGECVHADVTCFDQDQCTDDSCNPTSGCVFTPNQQCVCDPNVELIKNGGFETPEVITSQLWDIFNSSFLGGWEVTWMSLFPSEWNGFPRPLSAYLELQRGAAGDPHDGNQLAELDTDWDGPSGSLTYEPASVKIYQDIQTIPGQKYNISFWFSPRPNTSAENNALGFNWDNGAYSTTVTNGAGENNTTWKQYTYTLTATSNTTRIEFSDLGQPSDSYGTYLDDVSVKCNPLTQSCGNNVIEQGETCELPDTNNNENCQQSTTQCADGNKTQTRDVFGNCDGLCGCVLDEFSAPVCVKNSCNATCAVDADCDDQNENTTDTCNLTTCLCENTPHTCGNGVIQGEEQCDNGAQNGQVCTPACESQCSYCSATCALVTLNGSTCGRGGDGGGGGGGGGHVVRCGDGIRELDEQCDDGNNIDGDGCSSTCRIEQIAGASTEQPGEVLGEATTRLPSTGGSPYLIMISALIVALGALIGIIILVTKDEKSEDEKFSKKNYINRTDNSFCYGYRGCGLPVFSSYKILSFIQTRGNPWYPGNCI